jgi:hypothetical protein
MAQNGGMAMVKSMYNSKGWILGICSDCGHANYVEPHGTTAKCKCSDYWTHHDSIPFGFRDQSGMTYLRSAAKDHIEEPDFD